MGTRGLTVVISDGTHKIAQYGQWDHYPSGQGLDALDFCRKHLKAESGRNAFKDRLARVQFSTDDERLGGCTFERKTTDYMPGSPTFGKKKAEQYPYAGRDNGADILQLVWDADKPVYLSDQIEFAGDSLMCEYAYVVDLDAVTLEVYRGFQKSPIDKDERFFKYFEKVERRGDNQYYPVRLLKKYALDDLPTKAVFLKECEPKEEDE